MRRYCPLVLILAFSCAHAQASSPQDQSQSAVHSAPAPPVPKIDPAKEAHIRQLMDITGAQNTAAEMMASMEKNLRPTLNQALPPGAYRDNLIDLFFAKFNKKADSHQLLDLIVPIYDKYFSDEDIAGLIKFYQTPLGQKSSHLLPNVMNESMSVGRKWGERLGRESMVEVLAEHPEIKKELEDAKQPAPQP
jgi:uncharacterized protein